MTKSLFFITGVSLIFTFSCKNEDKATVPLTDLKWLEGKWLAVSEDSMEMYEQWRMKSDESLEGSSVTLQQGDTVFYEAMTISVINSSVVFNASVSGTDPVPFVLVKYESREATFENEEHDFPQRIIYAYRNDSTLYARIEGNTYEGYQKQEFYFKRATD